MSTHPEEFHPAVVDVVVVDLSGPWQPAVEPEAGGDVLRYAYGLALHAAGALRRVLCQRDAHPCLHPAAMVSDLLHLRDNPRDPFAEPGPDSLFETYQDALHLLLSLRWELCARQDHRCRHEVTGSAS